MHPIQYIGMDGATANLQFFRPCKKEKQQLAQRWTKRKEKKNLIKSE